MAGHKGLSGSEFKRLVYILKTAVGRSDEILKRVIFESGRIGAGDGCLSVWIDLEDIDLPDFEVSLEVLWAFSKHAGDEVVFSQIENRVIMKSGEALLAVEKAGVEEHPPDVSGHVEVDLKRLEKGLDYVSRPLDEDDSVEIHVFKRRMVFVGRSTGVSAVFVYGDLDFKNIGLRVPYQSSRRTVKVLSELGKNAKIDIGENGMGISVNRFTVFLCGERIRESVKFPKTEGGVEFDIRSLLKLLERGSDVMGNRNAELVFKGGKAVVRGERRGIFYTDSVDLGTEVPEFSSEVPLRKLRSYLAAFGGKKVLVSVAWGIVTFRDFKGEKYVHIRGKAV